MGEGRRRCKSCGHRYERHVDGFDGICDGCNDAATAARKLQGRTEQGGRSVDTDT